MLRWLALVVILLLLALDGALPYTQIGRRGNDMQARADVRGAVARIGGTLPDIALNDIDGTPVRISDFRGRRVLITFERSIDW
jgi:cytochrome oxidase Cu insertion factor (SCO1/SenC/PrrC family)